MGFFSKLFGVSAEGDDPSTQVMTPEQQQERIRQETISIRSEWVKKRKNYLTEVWNVESMVSNETLELMLEVGDVADEVIMRTGGSDVDGSAKIDMDMMLDDYIVTPIQLFRKLPAEDRPKGDESLRTQYRILLTQFKELQERIRTAGLQDLEVQAKFLEQRFNTEDTSDMPDRSGGEAVPGPLRPVGADGF